MKSGVEEKAALRYSCQYRVESRPSDAPTLWMGIWKSERLRQVRARTYPTIIHPSA